MPVIPVSAWPTSPIIHAARVRPAGGHGRKPLCARGKTPHTRLAAAVTCPDCLHQIAEQGHTAAGPSLDQLLNLADRAARTILTPTEAAALRAGITALTAVTASATGRADTRHRRLAADNRRLRAELRDLKAQTAEQTAEQAGEQAGAARVRDLARRWLHIPARRPLAMRVLAALDNTDTDSAIAEPTTPQNRRHRP